MHGISIITVLDERTSRIRSFRSLYRVRAEDSQGHKQIKVKVEKM